MDPLFVIFTLAMAVATLLAGYHAYTTHHLPFYGVSLFYGILLEQLVILWFEEYTYPVSSYFLTVFDVPLAISFGWGAIIYTGYMVATHYEFKPHCIPLFAALFALHIDLSMDVIAANMGYWEWLEGGLWFGVPLGNFFGWYCVVLFYTGSYVFLKNRVNNQLLSSSGALITSLIFLVTSLEIWSTITESLPHGKAIILSLIIFISSVILLRSDYRAASIPIELRLSTAVFHVFFLALYIGTGMLFHPTYIYLLPVTIFCGAIGVLILEQPSWASLNTTVRSLKDLS